MYSLCMNIYVYEYIHLYSLEICGIFSMENYKKNTIYLPQQKS